MLNHTLCLRASLAHPAPNTISALRSPPLPFASSQPFASPNLFYRSEGPPSVRGVAEPGLRPCIMRTNMVTVRVHATYGMFGGVSGHGDDDLYFLPA